MHMALSNHRGAIGASRRPPRAPPGLCTRGAPACALLHKAPPQRSAEKQEVALPINYAQLLGLRWRETLIDPQARRVRLVDSRGTARGQILGAYEDLSHLPLQEGYTQLAWRGKEKLLFAARDGLRTARGQTSALPRELSLDPLLLPGAMALLEQVGEHKLAVTLAEQADLVDPRQLRLDDAAATGGSSTGDDARAASLDAPSCFRRDVAFAAALAHCGLGKQALDRGELVAGYGQLEAALRRLARASGGAGAGGPLAPSLQLQLREALAGLQPDAILEFIKALSYLTSSELCGVADWEAVASSSGGSTEAAAAAAAGSGGARPSPAEATAAAAAAATRACPWRFPGAVQGAGVAHLVAGMAQRRPSLVVKARKLLSAARAEGDATVTLAVCEVLLGDPQAALALLEEDERIAATLRGQQRPAAFARAAAATFTAAASASGSAAAAAAASHDAAFPQRNDIMSFIRAHSPSQASGDLLPGLCLFTEAWLSRVAFPQLRDVAALVAPAARGGALRPEGAEACSLHAYFADPRVQAFLAMREGRGSLVQVAAATVRAALARALAPRRGDGAALLAGPAPPARGPLARALAPLLRHLPTAAVLVGAVLLGLRAAGLGSGPPRPAAVSQVDAPAVSGLPGPAALPKVAAAEAEAAVEEAAAVAAAGALQPQQEQEQQRRGRGSRWQTRPPAAEQQQPAAAAAAGQAQEAAEDRPQAPTVALTKKEAHVAIKRWLNIKAKALGPRHDTSGLAEMLASPMLEAVTEEADQSAAAGWFWRIRPLGLKVDSLRPAPGSEAEAARAVVLATVEESADLWASNGKHGDSYRTTYQVEYEFVRAEGGAWKIAAATVLGQ
eukprot:scaffold9.g3207.t1